jgi:hypothetical protein
MALAKKSLITPKGVANYPWINKPDTKFNKTEFKCGLVFADVAAAKSVIDAAKEVGAEQFGPKAKVKLPLEKQEDGTVLLRTHSKSKPPLIDIKGNEVKSTVKLGGGSIVKLGITLQAYDNGGKKGVTAYLNGVQIIKLVEYGGGTPAFGSAEDEAEDGEGFVAGDYADESEGDDGEELSAPSSDEDPSEF